MRANPSSALKQIAEQVDELQRVRNHAEALAAAILDVPGAEWRHDSGLREMAETLRTRIQWADDASAAVPVVPAHLEPAGRLVPRLPHLRRPPRPREVMEA